MPIYLKTQSKVFALCAFHAAINNSTLAISTVSFSHICIVIVRINGKYNLH